MPSPFPGMDPYLEDPRLWPDVHHELISESRAILAGKLRPQYQVRIEERVYICRGDDPAGSVLIPDLQMISRPGRWGELPAWAAGGGVEVAEPIEVVIPEELEVREPRLEILDREGNAVVTVVGLLSPANKAEGSRGQESFDQKRAQVLDSKTHWVEIDLLRGGTRFHARRLSVEWEYLVNVSRARPRARSLYWPIRLSQRLPVIPIPLAPDDPDALLDLQAVITTAYDRAGYDLSVDYPREPDPPLPYAWSAWADGLLRSRGLRTG